MPPTTHSLPASYYHTTVHAPIAVCDTPEDESTAGGVRRGGQRHHVARGRAPLRVRPPIINRILFHGSNSIQLMAHACRTHSQPPPFFAKSCRFQSRIKVTSCLQTPSAFTFSVQGSHPSLNLVSTLLTVLVILVRFFPLFLLFSLSSFFRTCGAAPTRTQCTSRRPASR